jgi:hypothetical protein
MHDPRTSTALRHRAELTADRRPQRWAWAVTRIDAKGRLVLPRDALDVLGDGALSRLWHRLACSWCQIPPAPGRSTTVAD